MHERVKPISKPLNHPSSSTSQHRRGSPKPRVTSTSDDIIPHKNKVVEAPPPPKPKKVKKVKEKV